MAKFVSKTHEQFVQELAIKNKKVYPVGTYVGATRKMDFGCVECNNIWSAQASSVLRGSSCPKCAKNTRLTQDEFIKKVSDLNPNVEITGCYVSAKVPVEYMCKLCGNLYKAVPGVIYSGVTCRSCGNKKIGDALRKSSDEFIAEMKDINQNIEFLDEYRGAKEKIRCKCLICGNIWSASGGDIHHGRGCPACALERRASSRRKPEEDLLKQIEAMGLYFNVSGVYKNNRSVANCHCRICGNDWNPTFSNILRGCGCPRCLGGLRMTPDEFFARMKDINPSILFPYGYMVEKYKIACRCAHCGHDFSDTKDHLLAGRGCPHCSGSSGEKRVRGILSDMGLSYQRSKTFSGLVGLGGGKLSYDFYIPEHNILIEVQGEQHRKPIKLFGGEEQFKIQKIHDERKAAYAREHGYLLICVWYDELDTVKTTIESLIEESRNDHSMHENVCTYAGVS